MSDLFKNLKIKYPVFTVQTPQSGDTYEVRSLTVSEVNSLRKSWLTRNRIHDHISRLLFGAIEKFPEHIKTYDDFKRNLTTKDREAIVYGIYVMTFGEERDFEISCPACEQTSKIKINLSKMFSINKYPYSENLIKSYKTVRSMKGDPDPVMESALKNIETASKQSFYPSIPGVMSPEDGMPEGLARQQFAEYFEILDNRRKKELEARIENKRIEPPRILDADEIEEEKARLKEQSKESFIDIPSTTGKTHSDDMNIFTRLISVKLPVCESEIYAYVRQPTVMHEYEILDKATDLNEEQFNFTEDTMIIDHFTLNAPSEENPSIMTKTNVYDRDAIIYIYGQLIPLDRDSIFQAYVKNFGDYCINLATEWSCAKCSSKNVYNLSMYEMFFRLVTES